MFSNRNAGLLAEEDDTERLVPEVRLERVVDGPLERELDQAVELWMQELSRLLRG
jgi:hypothetical protein